MAALPVLLLAVFPREDGAAPPEAPLPAGLNARAAAPASMLDSMAASVLPAAPEQAGWALEPPNWLPGELALAAAACETRAAASSPPPLPPSQPLPPVAGLQRAAWQWR
eukprot:6673606-Alexandrium_andersonii.AAC.2